MHSRPKNGSCAHCCKIRYLHSRGLCNFCYRRAEVREKYGESRQSFTTLEKAQVCEWVELGISCQEIARRLHRSYASICSLCQRLGARHYRKRPDELREGVQRLFQSDRSDSWIAVRLGCAKDTVRRHRMDLGLRRRGRVAKLPAEPKAKRKVNVSECWACGVLCPSGNQIRKSGWVARRHSDNNVEIYCAACFAEWGWPPLVHYISPDDTEEGVNSWVDSEVDQLLAMRRQGIKIQDCAKELNRTKSSTHMKINALRKQAKETS